MAFAAKSVLDAMIAKLETFSMFEPGAVYKGVQDGYDRNIVAVVALGASVTADKTMGELIRGQIYLIILGVRTADGVDNAEDVACDFEDMLTDAWVSDRSVAGTADDSKLEDHSGDPEYAQILGQEFRLRAYHWIVTQRRMF